MQKANFDISHELDEFLMVERPLTATKRKQNVDLNKLKPEYRQLEEQYVLTSHLKIRHTEFVSRFTNFDYTRPKRMSYYPHNQPLMVALTHEADGGVSIDMPRRSSQSQSQSNTLVVGVSTIGENSRVGTPAPINYSPTSQMTMPAPPERALIRTPMGNGSTEFSVGRPSS